MYCTLNEPSSYTRRRMVQAFHWRSYLLYDKSYTVDDPRVQLQWDQYENINWTKVLKGKLVANAYNRRRGLIRKANLAYFLEKYIHKHPGCILSTSIPLTVIIDIDPSAFTWSLIDARDAMDADRRKYKQWILKPSLCDGAAEVKMINSYEQLSDMVKAQPDIGQWVLQKYFRHPLLLQGHKFHLRVYVLAVGSLSIYVCEDILCLIAVPKYDPDSKDIATHITNTCMHEKNPAFKEEKYIRLLSELTDELGSKMTSHIFNMVKKVVAETFMAFRGEFEGFLPLPNCFEIFGFDFLLTEKGDPILLEINAGPDFKNTGQRLGYIITSLMEDVFALAIDKLMRKHDDTKQNESQKGPSKNDNSNERKHTCRLHLVHKDDLPWGAPNMDFT